MSFLRSTLLIALLAQVCGCHIGFPKFGDNTTDQDDSDNNDGTVGKITIATDVLASINRNLALVAPMRGGLIFGTIKNNVANIKYFLYDYASKADGYSPGDNLDRNAKIAAAYVDDNKYPLKTLFGVVHSSPGTLSHIYGSNEKNIDAHFDLNPQQKVYILGIVTMGAQTMAVIKEHEVKLSDDAKISFYVKERGKLAVVASTIETYSSVGNAYQKVESNIVSQCHVVDARKDLSLDNLGLRSLTTPKANTPFYIFNFGPKVDIAAAFPLDYPQSAPTLGCFEKNTDGTYKNVHLNKIVPNWLASEKDPKNFHRFFENFITHECAPKSSYYSGNKLL